MIKCKICGKGYKDYRNLGIHVVHSHKILSKGYYDKFLKKEDEGICPECGNQTMFGGLRRGYRVYCSIICAQNSKKIKEKIKQTNLKKYGVKYPLQLREVKEKIKQTNLKKYGVENISQCDKIKEEKRKTTLKNYNVEYPLQSKEIRKKTEKTNLEKYGVKNPSQSKDVKEKKKQTTLENYSVENPFQSEKVKEKIQKTNLEKYGAKNPNQSNEIRKKTKKTSLKKYGVEYFLQSEGMREMSKKTSLKKHGVEHPKQSHIKNYDKWYNVKFIEESFITKENYICMQEIMEFFNLKSQCNVYLHLKKLKIKYKRRNELLTEDLSKWKLYCFLVDRETGRWKREVYKMWDGYNYYTNERLVTNKVYRELNPNKHLSTNPLQPTIDHKVSKYYGFRNGILPTAVGNITNLCVCSRKSNSEKGRNII